jgi:hypothetical protein
MNFGDPREPIARPGAHKRDPLPERLLREISALREIMFTVHYFAEASWLAAAIDFPQICKSGIAQEGLRSARAIAWEFGFTGVATWLSEELLTGGLPGTAKSLETLDAKTEDARGSFWGHMRRTVLG